jgi:hypothetical protein
MDVGRSPVWGPNEVCSQDVSLVSLVGRPAGVVFHVGDAL